MKVSFGSTDKFLEFETNFESKGTDFEIVYNGNLSLAKYQKVKFILLKDISDMMNADTKVIEDILNSHFTISRVKGSKRDFELTDAIIVLNSFIYYTEAQKKSNKKK